MTQDKTIKIIKDLIKLGLISKSGSKKKESKRRSRKNKEYNDESKVRGRKLRFYRSRVGGRNNREPRQRQNAQPYDPRGTQTFTQTPQKHIADEQAQLNLELGRKALTLNQSIVPSTQPRLTIKSSEEQKENNDEMKMAYVSMGQQIQDMQEEQSRVKSNQAQITSNQRSMFDIYNTQIEPIISQQKKVSKRNEAINQPFLSDNKKDLIQQYKAEGGKANNMRVLNDNQIKEMTSLLKDAKAKGIPIEEVSNTTSIKAVKAKIASVQSKASDELVEDVDTGSGTDITFDKENEDLSPINEEEYVAEPDEPEEAKKVETPNISFDDVNASTVTQMSSTPQTSPVPAKKPMPLKPLKPVKIAKKVEKVELDEGGYPFVYNKKGERIIYKYTVDDTVEDTVDYTVNKKVNKKADKPNQIDIAKSLGINLKLINPDIRKVTYDQIVEKIEEVKQKKSKKSKK